MVGLTMPSLRTGWSSLIGNWPGIGPVAIGSKQSVSALLSIFEIEDRLADDEGAWLSFDTFVGNVTMTRELLLVVEDSRKNAVVSCIDDAVNAVGNGCIDGLPPLSRDVWIT